jgi:hypothetical protein
VSVEFERIFQGVKVMTEDNSLEFDMFEDMRRRLVEVLVSEGRERLDAEKIALYVVQGMREMPRLVKMLSESRSHPRAGIISTLKLVLENASALEKARELLCGLEAEEQS